MAGRSRDIHGGDIWLASRSSGSEPSGIIDFSASINPLGLPASVEKALKKSIRSVVPYPDPASIELIEALSSFHGVKADEVVPANGSNEIISILPKLAGKGSALIVEPAFSEYRLALALNGVRIKSYVLRDETGFNLHAGRLQKAMTGSSVIYIANPSNPAGALTPKETLLDVITHAKKTGVLVVVDEAFADFTGVSVIPEAIKAGNVIVLRSMTKFYAMAGLRLGYAVGHKDIIGRLSELIPAWSVNTLATVAGVAALKDAAFRKKTFQWLLAEREFLYKGLSSIDGIEAFEPSANYIMARLQNHDSRRLRKALLEREGILIRELSAFQGLGPEYFRVAVLGREANVKLLSALKRYLKKS